MIGLATVPPNTPECRSCSPTRTCNSPYTMPRSPTQMVGNSGREHLGVADDRGVGLQARRLREDVLLDVLAAGLLLALDQEAHVDRQLAVLLA